MNEIAEFICPGHPDKICDRIADLLVDAVCARDPRALAGVEIALHRHQVFVTGCLTTNPPLTAQEVNILVRQAFWDAGYGQEWSPHPEQLHIHHDLRLEALDTELNHLRSISDDQAICVGYAVNDPENAYLPAAHRLAYLAGQHIRNLRQKYNIGPDSKVIVELEDKDLKKLSISVQHHPNRDKTDLYRLGLELADRLKLSDRKCLHVNGGGDFDVGGPHGDNGLSGKKLVVDAYGPHIPIGGGAWSGKDPHKVDRVGGLMSRFLALKAIELGLGHEAVVTLGWFPGDLRPSVQQLRIDGQPTDISVLGEWDLSIDGIWKQLDLGSVSFADYADGSWFQKPAPWNICRPLVMRADQKTSTAKSSEPSPLLL